LYYPPLDRTAVGHQSAQAPRAAGQCVRGVANTTAITYGNRPAKVVAFLNSKDTTPPPATRKANRRLVNVGRTMANTPLPFGFGYFGAHPHQQKDLWKI
jgi:hypothetical protein